MLPTYTIYLDDWHQEAEVYGKVINWADMCKLNDLHAFSHNRATNHFIFVAVNPTNSTMFPYTEPQEYLHSYSHIPELTSDQVDQLIFIHSLNR